MKKQIFANGIVYFICMLVAAVLNLAISELLVKFVDILIAPEFFVLAIVRAASGILVGALVLGLVVGYEGFRSLTFAWKTVLASMLVASVLHFLLSLLLRFYPFVAGGTHYFAGLIDLGEHFSSADGISDIYLWAYIAAFFIAKAVECLVALFAAWLGPVLRRKNRETIRGYPHDAETGR